MCSVLLADLRQARAKYHAFCTHGPMVVQFSHWRLSQGRPGWQQGVPIRHMHSCALSSTDCPAEGAILHWLPLAVAVAVSVTELVVTSEAAQGFFLVYFSANVMSVQYTVLLSGTHRTVHGIARKHLPYPW